MEKIEFNIPNPNRHINCNIFTHILLTPIKRLYCINKRNFSCRCEAGFVGGLIFCTTQQLHYPFADVAVLSSESISNKKSIVHTLSLKEVFFVRYI